MSWKQGLRWAGLVALVPVFLAATVCAALAYPQPFFAYHIERGRLALYSDRPFDAAGGDALLARVEARLEASGINDDAHHAIFIANAPWRRTIFMNVAAGAGGVNFFPLTRNVFLRESVVARDQLIRPDGTPAEDPRTLTYFAAHEIGHSLTGARLGAAHLWNWRLAQWVREGTADYVGLGGAVDVDALYARYRARDPKMDYARTGQYIKFRLLAAYFLNRAHWSMDRLLTCGLGEEDAVKRMDDAMTRR